MAARASGAMWRRAPTLRTRALTTLHNFTCILQKHGTASYIGSIA
ncbi:hypothetical protein HMPREF3192_00242 [Atopobium deltae]|uniref:Uncharacterized protein n=1 Tax=Atopobium deltae TaxID=1393034 RepID=A0A133XWQ4_9ACTN|nr:hypothetical protein HMPREF3192_00242 [Atopobium deltae]